MRTPRFAGACLITLACACATAPPPAPHHSDDHSGEPPPLVVIHKRSGTPRTVEAPPPAPTAPLPTAPSAPGPTEAAGAMIVHLLDVGQGASTLIELPCGAVLVDTGGESNEEFNSTQALHAQLEAFFKRRADLKRTIDVLFITHPHIDHVRGIPDVVSAFTVKNVVDNGLLGESNVKDQEAALHDFVQAQKPGYRAIKRDDVNAKTGMTDDVIDPLKCKPVDPLIRVLAGSADGDPGWGEDKYGKKNADNMNNHSVVVRIDYGKSSFLVTGDLEEPAIKDLVDKYRSSKLLDADVFEAGHHGSYNGTTAELVAAVTPKVVLISMGPESRHKSWTAWAYGHPREQAIEMLERSPSMTKRPSVEVPIGTKVKGFVPEKLDAAIYGTGWDGAVDVVMGADGSIAVKTEHTVPHS